MNEERTAELEQKMQALFAEFADVLGPQQCALHELEECDCDQEQFIPVPGGMMVEYLITSCWMSMDSGHNSYEYFVPPGMAFHHVMGLVEYIRTELRNEV